MEYLLQSHGELPALVPHLPQIFSTAQPQIGQYVITQSCSHFESFFDWS
jgi:hypothetical protein